MLMSYQGHVINVCDDTSDVACSRYAHEHLAFLVFPELKECEGVIVVPSAISREEADDPRIVVIKRGTFHIPKIEIAPEKWFIVQSCRTASYENDFSCYLQFTDYMH